MTRRRFARGFAAAAGLLCACGGGAAPERPAGLPAPGAPTASAPSGTPAAPPAGPSGHDAVAARRMADDGLVHDFEAHPNLCGGNVGAYGEAEPDFSDGAGPEDSLYLAPGDPDHGLSKIHGGRQSFRIVWGRRKERVGWASFGMDLGPVLDSTREPARIESRDVSAFRALSLWIRGARGGERFAVTFRDAAAPDYLPQARIVAMPQGLPDTAWHEVVVPLAGVRGVDFTRLVHVGLDLGENLPAAGAVYLDDVRFVR